MMMQEIFEYYFEQKQSDQKNKYVTPEELQKAVTFKLDTVRFTDFVGRLTAERDLHDPIAPLEERLHNIERQLLDLATKNEVKLQLKPKADIEMIRTLEKQDELTLSKVA